MGHTKQQSSNSEETKGKTSGDGMAQGRARKIRILGHPLGFEHWALLPLFIFLGIFVLYPMFELIRMSFSTVTASEGEFIWEFTGLQNFYTMLDDRIFHRALLNTLLFVAVTVVGQVTLGTMLAVLVERARFLVGIARNVLIWPAIITPVAISVTWWLILNIEFGLLNYVLEAVGLPEQSWLASPRWALIAVAVVDIWHWTPMVFLIVLAGMANIDQSLYEAARVDGASQWTIFLRITLPLLAPTLVVAAMVRTILGFKTFDEIYLITGGGPGVSSEVISTYIQGVFFEQTDFGYGAFLGLFVITLLVALFLVYYGARVIRGRIANG